MCSIRSVKRGGRVTGVRKNEEDDEEEREKKWTTKLLVSYDERSMMDDFLGKAVCFLNKFVY